VENSELQTYHHESILVLGYDAYLFKADSTPSPTSEVASELGEEEYEIEYIVDSRLQISRGRRTLEFLIHWKDYGKRDRSSTVASQFEDDDPPVVEFCTRCPGKPRVGGVKSPVKGMDGRGFFERVGGGAKDKENVDERKLNGEWKEKVKIHGKKKANVKDELKKGKGREVEKKPAVKRKRKTDSDESDLVMDEEEAEKVSDEDDLMGSEVAEEDDGEKGRKMGRMMT